MIDDPILALSNNRGYTNLFRRVRAKLAKRKLGNWAPNGKVFCFFWAISN